MVDDVALRPAARGIYDPIAASLVAQDMVLLVVGILVIVARIRPVGGEAHQQLLRPAFSYRLSAGGEASG